MRIPAILFIALLVQTTPANPAVAAVGATRGLDVQATADRVLVANHDSRLEPGRCVDADGPRVEGTPLRRLTWAQLDGIDCGSNGTASFPGRTRTPAPIPRLAEALALARDASYPVHVNIEIKLQDEKNLGPREMADLVVKQVRDHGMIARTIILSEPEPDAGQRKD